MLVVIGLFYTSWESLIPGAVCGVECVGLSYREREREKEKEKYSTQMPIYQHWGCVLYAAELLLMLIY